MVGDVTHSGVEAGEVATNFWVRNGARSIQRNLKGEINIKFTEKGQNYQIFLCCIALTSISDEDIIKRLFVLQRKLVNTHVGNPTGTGSTLRVPSMNDACVMILGVSANLPHIISHFTKVCKGEWVKL